MSQCAVLGRDFLKPNYVFLMGNGTLDNVYPIVLSLEAEESQDLWQVQ